MLPADTIRRFCGACVSLSLALPLARFYTRSLFFDRSWAEMGYRSSRKFFAPGGSPICSSRVLRCELCARFDRFLTQKKEGGGDTFRGVVRLSRQSLRDLQRWRNLTRGESRSLQAVSFGMNMHSDASDVGFGETLGFDSTAGMPGLWESQGLGSAKDRLQSITLQELRAVQLRIAQSFVDYVSGRKRRRIPLREDNQAVVSIINAMVSASKPMMTELRKLNVFLHELDIKLEARWIQTAVNRFADALSRTWNQGDVRASRTLVQTIEE